VLFKKAQQVVVKETSGFLHAVGAILFRKNGEIETVTGAQGSSHKVVVVRYLVNDFLFK
jgi:hypothetical protein